LFDRRDTQFNKGQMIINQGDIYWIKLDEPDGLEPGIAHPYVVVQEDAFNHSRIDSLVVCALTTNIKQAKAPGNVLLEPGEANLIKRSVVVVSKISVVNKTTLGEYIGSLTCQRIDQILAGIRFLQLMTDHQEFVDNK
jgi:mRNA interferase MazF